MLIEVNDKQLAYLIQQCGGPFAPKNGDQAMTAEGVGDLRTTLTRYQAGQIGAPADYLAVAERLNTAMRDGVYWYRRAEFAEVALEEFITHEASWKALLERVLAAEPPPSAPDEDEPAYIRHEIAALLSAMAGANAVLAERRKQADDFKHQNFEDYIRDRRQAKALAWALRTFNDTDPTTGTPLERVFRFFEEAVELLRAVAEETMTDLDKIDAFHRRVNQIMNDRLNGTPGQVNRELGQAAFTLIQLAEVLSLSLSTEEKREFERVLSVPKADWEARHQKKIDRGM